MAKPMPFTIEQVARHSFRAYVGKRLVGSASAWQDSDDRFVILESFVKPAYRRRGIATALYQAIEEAAGAQLTPAHSLSDDAFEFWKAYRPEAVANDLRHRREALMGAKVVKDGRLATIMVVGPGNVTIQYDDATELTNSRSTIFASQLDAALAAALSLTARPDIEIEEVGRWSYLARRDGLIVGKAVAWEKEGRFEILRASVHELHRRQGIATMLYQRIEQDAGRLLTPAHSLSDDAFEFWKRYRPEAIAHDLRHRREALMGAKVVKNGRIATITRVEQSAVSARYDDVSERANSETIIPARLLDAALQAARPTSLANIPAQPRPKTLDHDGLAL